MIKAVLYKARENKDGLQPIYIRVTRHAKASYISLGRLIDPKKWDEGTGRAKKNYIGHEDLNERITNKISELDRAENKLLIKDDKVAATEVTAKTKRGEESNIFMLAKSFIQQFNNKRQAATYLRYETHLNKLHQFIGEKKGIKEMVLHFDRIDADFLNEFDEWLAEGDVKKKRKPLGANTRWTVFKNIRALFNHAIGKGIISSDSYPFRRGSGFELPSENNEKEALDEKEILKMMAVPLDPYSTEFHSRNSWLVSFFLQGCRISDTLSLRFDELSDDCTQVNHKVRKSEKKKEKDKKKEQWLRLTVPPQAVAIFRWYKEYNDQLDKPSRYVMPHIKNVDYDDLPRAISTATAITNEALKKVCVAACIKVISTHSARRSYANRTAETKSVFSAQQLLKHSSLNMTQRYLSNMKNDKLSAENAEISAFIPNTIK